MTAEELGGFERRIRAAFQHHSLIDLIIAIAIGAIGAISSSAKAGTALGPPTHLLLESTSGR